MQRRAHSTNPANRPEEPNKPVANGTPKHDHEHDHKHDQEHSHSHSLFHTHSHGEEGHSHSAESIVAAWQGAGDRGSQITILGLFSNIGLTAVKGVAGWYMHSASLLADAGHSLSDLVGDLVVLFCWRLSRKPPTERYPYGFAKFETLGTTTVSLLLIGGALGIGFHSYSLLLSALAETASTLPSGPLQEVLHNVTIVAPSIPEALHHEHLEIVDPNAAWFAALSIVTKEWLYRLTKRVADEENSPVLMANAIHHRSDVYSSAVALCAILGGWLFPLLPLDPLGGLLVSFVILRQSFGLLYGTWADLTDAGVSPKTRQSLKRTLDPLLGAPAPTAQQLLGIADIRARRAGSLIYVDLVAQVPPKLSIQEASAIEEEISAALKQKRKEVAEVRVKFQPTFPPPSSFP